MNLKVYLSIFNLLSIYFIANGTTHCLAANLVSENQVQFICDIRYGKKPKGIGNEHSSDRILDLYLPLGINKKLPVLIFIHGGGFSGGDKSETKNFCFEIAKHGIAVISLNYYLTMKYKNIEGVKCSTYMANGISENGFHPLIRKAILNASKDTCLAFKWIKKNESKFNFDSSLIALAGGSAGAMTALYTAYISNQNILPIRAVVNLWGGVEKPNLIKKGACPVLTFHGDQDKLIHVDYAYALHNRMKTIQNYRSKLYILEGRGHAIYTFIIKEKIDEIISFLQAEFMLQ